jgi:hypothetical protein
MSIAHTKKKLIPGREKRICDTNPVDGGGKKAK